MRAFSSDDILTNPPRLLSKSAHPEHGFRKPLSGETSFIRVDFRPKIPFPEKHQPHTRLDIPLEIQLLCAPFFLSGLLS
jgi:hypothetical protein